MLHTTIKTLDKLSFNQLILQLNWTK